MSILDFIIVAFFIFLMIFLIVGFNHQMSQKSKEREERFQKYNTKEKQ
ncbi:large conductance mechanosensitive channel protein MscL [Campylobacter estrildidarum]|nr:MscL family protein [Campylobacter estrildidarum]